MSNPSLGYLPIETYRTQVGSCEGNVWWIDDFYLWAKLILTSCMPAVGHYIPHIDVEVA
jgi:hypothetical protein